MLKKTRSKAAIACFIFTLALPGFVFSQQKPRTPSGGDTSSGRPSTGAPGTARRVGRASVNPKIPLIQQDFDEALSIVQEHYISGKKLDYNTVFKSSILGMLRSLDPHSNYYDREEFDELKTEQHSEYYGIGASIQSYNVDKEVDTFITATFDSAPASRAGLRFGDRILEVDGVKMTGKPSIEVRDKIRGPRGTLVRITVERASDKRVQTVAITRDAVPQPSIPDAYLIRPGVGYVDMTRGFNYTTTDELRDALDRLRAKGMNSLVLDLRNNPGGFLDQAIHVAEVFLPRGQEILTQKGRNGHRDNIYKSQNNAPDSTPLVILINENTASASEIVAGAMQDHDRALIVGKTSFGKGLVQSIIPLEYGAALTLTSAKYYTPSGRLIQRDYSNGGFYDYYTQGGSIRLEKKDEVEKPSGPEKKTDGGRAVYGGGGINPDEIVSARTITPTQRRLLSPMFSFARDLINGRIRGSESYKVQGAIDFSHELEEIDYPITDSLFRSFKEFVMNDRSHKPLAPVLDHNRPFLELYLRYNIITAAYGRVMADRVLVTTDDLQIAKAIDLVPRARDLAMSSMGRRIQP